MRKPDNIVYWQNDAPPARIAIFLAIQQVAFLAALLVIPSVFATHEGMSGEDFLNIVSATLIVSAFAILIQVMNRGGIGSGHYYPMQATSAILPAMYMASQSTGLAASFGMIAVIGLTQVVCSAIIVRLRSIFTVEVAGLSVLLFGVGLGQLGLHLIFESAPQGKLTMAELSVGMATFMIMVGCNVWVKSRLRLFATLIGLLAGTVLGWFAGLIEPQNQSLYASTPWFRIPDIPVYGWSLDPAMILPYVLTGIFMALASIGTQTLAQQANDADWQRPDLPAYGRGLRAEGLSNLLAAMLNGLPLVSSGGGVTQAAASGSTSRHLAWWVAGVFVLLALLPKAILLWLLLPNAVMGGLLLFLSTFTMLSGMQLIGSRMLDNRRVLAIGAGLASALSYSAVSRGLNALSPTLVDQVIFTSFTAGILVTLVLTALLRLGVKRRTSAVFTLHDTHLEEITEYLERQGRLWGARREVVRRAELTCWQTFELLVHGGYVAGDPGTILLNTGHDEFTLSVEFRYRGTLPPLSNTAPTPDELIEDPKAQDRMAGYLISQASQVRCRINGDICSIQLTFAD